MCAYRCPQLLQKALFRRFDLAAFQLDNNRALIPSGRSELPQKAGFADPAEAMEDNYTGAFRVENFAQPIHFTRPTNEKPGLTASEPVTNVLFPHGASPCEPD